MRNPDIQAEEFNTKRGEFSLEAEESFEKHLRRLKAGDHVDLWYGSIQRTAGEGRP